MLSFIFPIFDFEYMINSHRYTTIWNDLNISYIRQDYSSKFNRCISQSNYKQSIILGWILLNADANILNKTILTDNFKLISKFLEKHINLLILKFGPRLIRVNNHLLCPLKLLIILFFFIIFLIVAVGKHIIRIYPTLIIKNIILTIDY